MKYARYYIYYYHYHYVLKCKKEKCIWKIFVKYTQIRQSNTNTNRNISFCGFSNTNTNTNTDICVFKYKYKYVFDPSPDFHWFSMTFPGKMPFFRVNIKFHDFSSQGLNSMTFSGLCEPCNKNGSNVIHFMWYFRSQTIHWICFAWGNIRLRQKGQLSWHIMQIFRTDHHIIEFQGMVKIICFRRPMVHWRC